MNRRAKLSILAPGASPEEAAAVVAAIEQFMRETAPPPAAAEPRMNPWVRASRLEATAPWGEDHMPWGRPA